MEFNVFCEQVIAGLQKLFGQGAEVTRNSVRKNNGVMLEGITISRPGVNIAPNIYLHDFYDAFCEGESLEKIVDRLAAVYERTRQDQNLNLDFFREYDRVKERLVYRLVNAQQNREWLEEVPFIPYLDMAITFQCLLAQETIGSATIQVTKEHCRMWRVDERELFLQAGNNTQRYLRPTITDMEEIVMEITADNLRAQLKQNRGGQEAEPEAEREWVAQMARQMVHTYLGQQPGGGMFVLSNHTRINGAAVILYEGVLKRFAQEKQYNFFILPSSVHEVILVPDLGHERPQALRSMVCEVNATQVEDEEKLSDSVYYYDRAADRVFLCDAVL